MKKIAIPAIAAVAFAGVANAQTAANTGALAPTKAADEWSISLKGGIVNPLNPFDGSFKENIRGAVGLEVRKQVSPTVGLGVEGVAAFNTATWNKVVTTHKNIVGHTYVGGFGAINLNNWIAGYAGQPRPFEVELVAGLGWIHGYAPQIKFKDEINDLGVRTGLNFNINLGEAKAWSINLSPSILWDVTTHEFKAFSGRVATLALMAGVTYHFGNSNGTHSFAYNAPCDYTPYNDQINALRAMVAAQEAGIADLTATNAGLTAANAQLQKALEECQNRPATVVKETNNTLESVRYVFYKIGSSKIGADQLPNVEMIAQYMKHNPTSTVEINGYASKDGNLEFNERLAKNRAEAVKTMLVNKYGIKADRINAKGNGIGEMFKEESWNRVAICILNEK